MLNGSFIETDITQWDNYHRAIQTQGNHPLNLNAATAYTIDQSFNDLDQLKNSQVTVAVDGTNWNTLLEPFYDHSGRMAEEYFTFDGTRRQICNTTKYNQWDAIAIKTIGNNLQTLDYTYYGNGFLESMNTATLGGLSSTSSESPNANSTNDLYSMALIYDAIGNITNWELQNRGFLAESNLYTYDGLNRIKSKNSSSSNFNQTFTYKDLIGNIDAITRYDIVDNAGQWQKAMIDDLSFTYPSTKSSLLRNVADASGNEKGYAPNNGNYIYDDNGNMTHDPRQQVTIAYTHFNLPTRMSKTDNSKIEYLYDASGTKWQHTVYDASDAITKQRSYIGGMEFSENRLELIHHPTGFIRNTNINTSESDLTLSGSAAGDYAAPTILSTQFIETGQEITYLGEECITLADGFETETGATFLGMITPSLSTTPSYQWEYKITDHLGNTRVVFADIDGDGMIRQSSDPTTNEVLGFYNYGAFGLELGGSHLNIGGSSNRYLYNGKELDTDFGLDWYHYGARMYDPQIGRFTGVDPISDQFAHLSTYNYASLDPIKNIDLWGLQGLFAADGKLIGYNVQEGQGPTQIAQDLNENYSCYLNCEIGYTDIVQDNAGEFANVIDTDGNIDNKFSDNFKSGNIDPNDQLVITDGKEVVNTADTEAKIARAQDVEDSLSGEISKSHKQAQVYKDLRAALKFERGLAPGGKGAKAGLGMSQARNENDSVNNVRLRTEVIRLKDSMTQEVKSKNPNALKNIDSSNN